MALAAFKCLKCTGTNAATETDVSKKPNFLSVDEVDATPSNHPITRPATVVADPTYSYEMALRWECTAAPDNDCTNFKLYGPSHQPDYEDNPGDCMFVMWGTSATGVTPVNSASTIATTAQYEASGGTGYYSVSTALSLGVNPGDDKIDAVGEKTDYLYAQLKLVGGVQLGDMVNQIWVILWEEK
jgi:hypothetical protein